VEDRLSLVVSRMGRSHISSVDVSGRLPEKMITGRSAGGFQAIAMPAGEVGAIDARDVQREIEVPAKVTDEGFVVVRLAASQAVVKVGHGQATLTSRLEANQGAEHGDTVGPAGYSQEQMGIGPLGRRPGGGELRFKSQNRFDLEMGCGRLELWYHA
jgi:hypothetical protein